MRAVQVTGDRMQARFKSDVVIWRKIRCELLARQLGAAVSIGDILFREITESAANAMIFLFSSLNLAGIIA